MNVDAVLSLIDQVDRRKFGRIVGWVPGVPKRELIYSATFLRHALHNRKIEGTSNITVSDINDPFYKGLMALAQACGFPMVKGEIILPSQLELAYISVEYKEATEGDGYVDRLIGSEPEFEFSVVGRFLANTNRCLRWIKRMMSRFWGCL